MRFYTKSRTKPTISIVSLVDILCILLIFFVVTTVFKSDEPVIKIDLPESSQAKAQTDNGPIVIYVTDDEKIFLSNVPIAIDQLGDALTKLRKELPSSSFALKSSKRAPFGLIIRVMDAVKAAGIKQLPAFALEAKGGT